MKNRSLLTLMLFVLLCNVSLASIVAIIDSGTDVEHKDLNYKIWENRYERTYSNNIDDDNNGYIDDFNGWNFAENNNEVIDYKYLDLLNDDVKKFFEIQAKSYEGTLTKPDLEWARNKLKEEKFLKRIGNYGNFMHGTHVAGIVAHDNDIVEILPIKLLTIKASLMTVKSNNNEEIDLNIIKSQLKPIAEGQMNNMNLIAKYMKGHKVDVANGSFGVSFNSISNALEGGFKQIYGVKATKRQLYEITSYFFEIVLESGKKMVKKTPNTLFVFAAGNDGMDNDTFPTSPTNIQAENVISVAATQKNVKLANFSNYGIKNVDVAAPGVNILSSAPGNEYLKVSGTSQAAPYVSKVAGRVKDINPDLTAGQIKRIIMETVDVKSWLKNYVKTSGVVNLKRAVRAARLSRNLKMRNAITQSHLEIPASDPISKSAFLYQEEQGMKELILPLPSYFEIK